MRCSTKKNAFKGKTIGDYIIGEEIGRGNIGVVYHARHKKVEDIEVAIKFVTKDSLKTGWDQELIKVGKLSGISQVVQYKSTPLNVTLNDVEYVLLFWEYIEGSNLRQYIKKNDINISFIEHFITEIFDAFIAMAATGITHGDLHEGNILIKPTDDRLPDPTRPVIKVTDFGIGGSHTFLRPKDDYNQLAVICQRLLEIIDPATPNGGDKFFYDKLTEDFIPKKILEKNPITGDFVKNPRALKTLLKEIRSSYAERMAEQIRQLPLENPFDYLSCEEMGDKFGMLQTLYSEKFPGYNDLLQRTNTILTGPRGCGKTTILRTLSLKTRLLGGKITSIDQLTEDYIGIYYHSNDLYFAFPYLKEKITDDQRRIIGSFFSLSVFYELIETLRISQKYFGELQKLCDLGSLEDYLKQCIPAYKKAFYSQSALDHLGSFIVTQKDLIRIWSTRGSKTTRPVIPLPLDFIKTVCRICIDCVPWLKGKVIYFFLDDYSLPRISKPIQEALNDFTLLRYSECFFKISTESIVTFHPYDSHGKLLERSREYDVIDLGDYFLNAEEGIKGEFLLGVINNRLNNTINIASQYKDISKLLSVSGRSFNQLAREIRDKKASYHGWDTIVNLCSGDVVNILILIRDMISLIGGPKMLTTYNESDDPKIPLDRQDKAIRELGNDFLNRIEAAPNVGKELRRIAEAFGNLAHWYLKNVDSKNVGAKPAHQAFRMEMLEPLVFSKDIKEKLKLEYNKDLSIDIPKIEELYRELIRYGVFIRDVRGKSQRGAVVPRLYLRRLLIPTFLLTPNKRDHIRVEVEEFYWLLGDPDSFCKHMIEKKKHEKRKKIAPDLQDKLL